MFKRLKARLEKSLQNDDDAIDSVEYKVLTILNIFQEAFEEGFIFKFKIFGIKIPFSIIVEPVDDTTSEDSLQDAA